MRISYFDSIDSPIIAIVLFAAMLAFIALGRWSAGKRKLGNVDNPGNAAITGAMYGLLGLMLAFTFGMAGSRFNERHDDILEEANAIGTAVLRADLYTDSARNIFRNDFRAYLEARIAYYDAHRDTTAIQQSLFDASRASGKLWLVASSLSRRKDNVVASNQMVPALNAMFDMATKRTRDEFVHTPESILMMLFFLAIVSAFVAGYTSVGKGNFDWLMALGFCFLTAMVVYFIIDLDRPRRGIVNLDNSQVVMTDLRDLWK